MLKSRKTKWLSIVSASAIAFAASQPTYAQDSEEDSIDDDNIIIVTATQRASDVQDIPIAVTAVTPAQLEQQGIQDIRTLGSVSSSFNLTSSQTESQGTSIRIRGVGTTGNNIGLESAVGVFIDGVYQSRPGVALGDLVDLQQVEVLRGPQGTLFGRNTTAGALVVRTKKPDLNDFEGFANASYGNFNAVSVQGGVSVPLIQDTLGFRLSGAYRNREGFLTNTAGDVNDRNRYLLRGQLLWEPNSDISLRIIGDYQNVQEQCCDAVVLTTPSLFSAADNAAAFPNGFGFVDGLRGLNANGGPIENDIEQWGVSAEFKWDFGAAEFTYIASYRDFFAPTRQDDFQSTQTFSVGGNTVTPGNVDDLGIDDDIQTWTQEARLQGTAFNDVLDWLVGVYYSDEQIEENFALTFGPDFSAVVGQANLGSPDALGLISAAGNFLGGGAFAPVSSDGAFAVNQFTQDGTSFSVFTHNIFNITDSFNITLGARYVDDSKDGTFEQIAANNPACLAGLNLVGALAADNANGTTVVSDAFAPFGPAVQGLVTNTAAVNGGGFINCIPFASPALGVGFLPAEFDESFDDDEFIYTVQAGWKPNDDLLIYGGFTHGYKAGGFNLDSSAAIFGADPSFNSEEIDAFELGIKSTILGGRGRINVALFYSDLSDFQVLEFTGTQFQTFNVDDVSSRGVEFEGSFQWTDRISNTLAITYTDAEYGDECDASFIAAGNLDATGALINPAAGLCGFPLTNAPEVVGIYGWTFDGPVTDSGWNLLANVNVRYESTRRTSTNPLQGTAVFDNQSGNVKINARLGFTTPDEKFTFELWGKNLSNEITRSITFGTSFLADSRSAFIEEPRTYGATIRAKF